jgi:CitMHS family citrate-Mg2+:H+ or citrate-Ca2+:H+ symporter
MVTVPAMLPLYQRAAMSPLTLTCITALAAGTMNMLPWGGPTTRAATALQVGATELFVPIIPAMLVGVVGVFLLAWHIGRRERMRLTSAPAFVDAEDLDQRTAVSDSSSAVESTGWPPLWAFNALLTAVTLAALFLELIPLAVVFMIASAIALVVNYPDSHEQRDRLTGHGAAAMMMVTTIFAAGVFTGVLTKSGMLSSMSNDLVGILPGPALRHFPAIMAVASMPLSLAFDPDSFYFGLLPVLANAAQTAGGSGVEVGRAAILGQMTTGFPVSPLTPATFLLVGLASVDLADHQRYTIPYAFAVTLLMAGAALLTGAVRL